MRTRDWDFERVVEIVIGTGRGTPAHVVDPDMFGLRTLCGRPTSRMKPEKPSLAGDFVEYGGCVNCTEVVKRRLGEGRDCA